MPWSRVLSFDDPLHYQAAIRAGDWQVYPTKQGQFRAELTQITLNQLWMQSFHHELPQIQIGAVIPNRKVIGFLTEIRQNRINEISFNSSLMREMRAVSFVTDLIMQNRVIDGGLRQVLIHSIADDEFMGALSPTSKYNADWDFLVFLRDQGRKCAGDWLAKNFVKLGVESSIDVDHLYL